MQTFLPYPDFIATASILDYKRLGKQRVEAKQILNALLPGSKSRWRNHPAVLMWKGYEPLLMVYHNRMITEWISRGYNNTMPYLEAHTAPAIYGPPKNCVIPPWLQDPAFHLAHQSNLIRKDPNFYAPKFPGVPDNLPYIWPTEKDSMWTVDFDGFEIQRTNLKDFLSLREDEYPYINADCYNRAVARKGTAKIPLALLT